MVGIAGAVDQAIDASRSEPLCRLPAHLAGHRPRDEGNRVLPKGKLKDVPIALDDFDVFFTGGRIQF